MKIFLDKLKAKLKYKLNQLSLITTYLSHLKSPLSSYAQCQEDQVAAILLDKIDRFIDIGAYDGINSSNTFLFALRGASGLCFEPIKTTFDRLRKLYFLSFKVRCICEGISDTENHYEIRTCGPFSSIDETACGEHRTIVKQKHKIDLAKSSKQKIHVRPLRYWLNRYPEFRQTDLISIDVEGHELNVLQGIDFDQLQAKLFVIENQINSEREYQINQLLEARGYQAVLKGVLNTFWLRKEMIKPENLDKIIREFEGYSKIEH